MKDKLPKISIISPVFNIIKSGRESFFRQMVESVHNQTYSNIEHIVQDGGSTDGTVEILKEYADKGWITFYSEKDKNVHDAINKAFNKISGSFFGILGSDDYYKSPDMIEDVVQNFILKTNPDYVYGDEEHISVKNDSFIKIWKGDELKSNFWRGTFCATEAIIFSKHIFDEIGGFDLNYPVVADLKLQFQLKLNDYKGVYCNRVIDCFRKGDGLSSNENALFFHKNEFAEICCELWKKFDSTMTPEKAEYMLKYDEYSEEFLMKCRRYFINLGLKNTDYVDFNKYIEGMISYYYDKKAKKHNMDVVNNTFCQEQSNYNTCYGLYPWKNLPILKIVDTGKCKKYYLFGKIPILKTWKER